MRVLHRRIGGLAGWQVGRADAFPVAGEAGAEIVAKPDAAAGHGDTETRVVAGRQ